MQNSLFSTALTPINARSHTRLASRHPRSSTPLRDVNTSNYTIMQKPVVQKKSSQTSCNTGKPDRKRKHNTEDIDVKMKAAKRTSKVSTVTVGKNDKLTSRTVSGRSHLIDSLAGELQQQTHEVMDIWCALLYDVCIISIISTFSTS